MGFLHGNGIVHGDLCGVSPGRSCSVLTSHSLHIKKNVLIGEDGKAYICGFDLSEFENVCRLFSDVMFLTLQNVSLFS